jgi:hypothetical protein
MKYLILALLVALSLPAMATIHLNSSRSNVVEDAASPPTSERAIVKSKSNITNNRENSAVEYKDGEDGVNKKGKPSKEQCAATTDAKVVAQCKQLGHPTTSNTSYREGGKNDGDKAVTFGRDQLKGSTKNSGHAVEK